MIPRRRPGLNRVFRLIDPRQLEKMLTDWGKQIVGILAGKHLSIDGKQLRGTRPSGCKQANVQIVSIWAEGEQMCLAQGQIDQKTNEIKAIPQVLAPLDITGSIVTIDAIGCQKAITELIVDTKKADYVIGLKANQDGLYEQVVAHFERVSPGLPTAVSRDLGHGRGEKRTVMVSEDLTFVDAAQGWVAKRGLCGSDSLDERQRRTQ